jgi:hypothetical protein
MSITISFRGESTQVERAVLEASCFYYQAMFQSPMLETINQTVNEHLDVEPAAWQTVLGALKISPELTQIEQAVLEASCNEHLDVEPAAWQTVLGALKISPELSLDILRLIEYLQPKKTSEGRRLTILAMQVITALSRCQSASSNAKVEALAWAKFYNHWEARDRLVRSLGSQTGSLRYTGNCMHLN